MALSNLVIPRITIDVAAGQFTVRGLSFNDISHLLHEFGSQIDDLIGVAQGTTDASGDVDVDSLTTRLLTDAPKLVARTIAYAADEPEASAVVEQLAGSSQLLAIEAIWRLTVEPCGGTKKFIGRLVDLFQGLRAGLPASTGI